MTIDIGTKEGEGILAWGFPVEEKNNLLKSNSKMDTSCFQKRDDGLYVTINGLSFEKIATIFTPAGLNKK